MMKIMIFHTRFSKFLETRTSPKLEFGQPKYIYEQNFNFFPILFIAIIIFSNFIVQDPN